MRFCRVFGRLHHRVAAALDAVPTAVLTALVAPSLLTKGPAEATAIIVSGLVALRSSVTHGVAVGLIVLIGLRLLLA